jgi:orotidine-5'-phosphate decarboxylase
MSEVSKAKENTTRAKKKIIVALDVETASQAREIIGELNGEIGAFKIGLQLFTSGGASFVREAVASNVKIFLDLKFHDIPNTVAKASVEAARLGVWMFNVHASGGGEMMRKTAETVREFCEKENLNQPKIIGVTVLTSSNSETLREIGIENETDRQVTRLSQLTANCGLDGVVASPHEIDLIRQNVDKKEFLIVTPGIRNVVFAAEKQEKLENENAKAGTYEDQQRVMSAKEAIRSGSDYLVIGRPVLLAKDRVLAVREIIKGIETA